MRARLESANRQAQRVVRMQQRGDAVGLRVVEGSVEQEVALEPARSTFADIECPRAAPAAESFNTHCRSRNAELPVPTEPSTNGS